MGGSRLKSSSIAERVKRDVALARALENLSNAWVTL